MRNPSTLATELDAHCRVVLTVLEDAGMPHGGPVARSAYTAWVHLRPALRILRVSLAHQRHVEDCLRTQADRLTWHLHRGTEGEQHLFVPMSTLIQFLRWGRHPVCIAYQVWFSGVLCAVMRHGHYDPLTGHTPPPGQELTALEFREEGRDLLNGLIPGIGDVVAGQRPTTEEGRRNIAYLHIDDDGTTTMLRDCDLPLEEDDDDALD